MDSDDISFPSRFEEQVKYMEKHPQLTVLTAWKEELEQPQIKWRRSTNKEEMIYKLHFNNIIGHPETIIRKSFLRKNNISYNENYITAVDYDLWRQILFAGGTFERMPKIVLRYRIHHKNPKAYYKDQGKTRRLTSKMVLTKYGINWSGDTTETCDLLEKMLKNNHNVGWLSDAYLIKKRDEICAKEAKIKNQKTTTPAPQNSPAQKCRKASAHPPKNKYLFECERHQSLTLAM